MIVLKHTIIINKLLKAYQKANLASKTGTDKIRLISNLRTIQRFSFDVKMSEALVHIWCQVFLLGRFFQNSWVTAEKADSHHNPKLLGLWRHTGRYTVTASYQPDRHQRHLRRTLKPSLGRPTNRSPQVSASYFAALLLPCPVLSPPYVPTAPLGTGA